MLPFKQSFYLFQAIFAISSINRINNNILSYFVPLNEFSSKCSTYVYLSFTSCLHNVLGNCIEKTRLSTIIAQAGSFIQAFSGYPFYVHVQIALLKFINQEKRLPLVIVEVLERKKRYWL